MGDEEKEVQEGYLYKVTEEDIRLAKEKHPNVELQQLTMIMDDDVKMEMIFMEPSTASFQRYLQAANDTKKKNASIAASNQYVKDNLVCPTWDQLHGIVQERPALTVQIANELAQGKGLVRESEKKTI